MTENNETLASITYHMKADNTIKIDIELKDFEKESIENLAQLCANIASDQVAYETIGYVRDMLVKNNQVMLLMPFVTKINEYSTMISKLFVSKEQAENKEKPCIRPSDMM